MTKVTPAEIYRRKNPNALRPRWAIETMEDYLLRIKILRPKPGEMHYAELDDYCWIYPVINKHHRYGVLGYNKKRKGVHIWSHETFIGPTNGLNVLHKCDIEACFNPKHLYAGTQLENMRDRFDRNRG